MNQVQDNLNRTGANRMKTTVAVIIGLLAIGISANAEFRTVSQAYEITLSDFRVPATPSSAVIFKECVDCDSRSIRVTPATRYELNGQPVDLKDFRARIFQIRDRSSVILTVLHHLESNTVIAVSTSL